MENIAFYIEDDRYSVATLRFVVEQPLRLLDLAEQCLSESPHHLSVEVRLDDRRIFKVSEPEKTSNSLGARIGRLSRPPLRA